jgi:hypothetical protein
MGTLRTLRWAMVCGLLTSACSSSTGGGGQPSMSVDGGVIGDGDTSTGPMGPPVGTMGGPCDVDGDCPSGELCLSPGVGIGTDKYCAPSCNVQSDCQAFAETSYNIGVPSTVTPQGGSSTPTIFGSVLARGYGCGPTTGHTGNYCQFACSDTEALGTDGHCYCLPGYAPNQDKTACVFSHSASQCSILDLATADQRQQLLTKYGIQTALPTCDACNSDMQLTNTVGCHTSVFGCNLNNTSLNGACAELLSPDAFNACLAQKENFSCQCDSDCATTCASGTLVDSECADVCCTCTQAASAPAPTCASDGGP